MSAGFDYSRFDHIGDSDEEDESPATLSTSSSTDAFAPTATIPSDRPPQAMTRKGAEGRFKFEYQGRTIYEWEQSLEEVNIYIVAPDTPRSAYEISISHTHVYVGIKSLPPYLDVDTGGPVKSK